MGLAAFNKFFVRSFVRLFIRTRVLLRHFGQRNCMHSLFLA